MKSQSPIMGASSRPHIDRSRFRGDSGASTSYLRCLKTVCKPEFCEPWTDPFITPEMRFHMGSNMSRTESLARFGMEFYEGEQIKIQKPAYLVLHG